MRKLTFTEIFCTYPNNEAFDEASQGIVLLNNPHTGSEAVFIKYVANAQNVTWACLVTRKDW